MYDDARFAAVPDRRGTWSEKWDQAGPDELPLWVADMDFPAPEPVLAALHRRLDHGVLGYPHIDPALLHAVAEHQYRAHGRRVDPSWIIPLPGLVCGLNLCARSIGSSGDGIITTAPIYPPFLSAPLAAQRVVHRLDLDPQREWRIEAAALAACGDDRVRAFWLCQPHNPSGRVFSDAELNVLASAAEENDWIVVSDEIWADLILDDGVPHRPFALACPQAAVRSITLTAPSKTWNIPGLGCSFAIIPDPALRRRFVEAKGRQIPDVNILGLVAAHAAYTEGGPWLAACRTYLRANREHLRQRLRDFPGLQYVPGPATYLAWIDARAAGDHVIRRCHQAGVFLSDGAYFGAPGWIRLNFACPRATLDAALDRLAKVFTA